MGLTSTRDKTQIRVLKYDCPLVYSASLSSTLLPPFAMADAVLKTWVSDHIHALLGVSERTLVQYVIAIASSASSSSSLFEKLVEADLPNDERSRNFAKELFDRVPRLNSKKAAKSRKSEILAVHRKNASFQLVDGGEDLIDDADSARASKRSSKRDKDKDKVEVRDKPASRKRHIRQRDELDNDKDWASDDENPTGSKRQRGNSNGRDISRDRSKNNGHDDVNNSDSDEYERAEQDRLADLKERDDFSQRLKLKDEERTKKVLHSETRNSDSQHTSECLLT